MPYASNSDVPDYVPSDKKSQWREVWNSAYNRALEDGKSKDKAEESAFAQANGVAGPNAKKEAMTKHFERTFSFTKLDERNHTVTGVITDQTKDKTGERFHYDKSKPYYQEWSNEFAKATSGQSLGNVREMHQLKAVGKLSELIMNDEEKVIVGTAKIVDADAWIKCAEGVYTGFSHGGDYVGDPWVEDGERWYVARPSEVSLVDNPCNPAAHFTFVKADGTEEVRSFSKREFSQEERDKDAKSGHALPDGSYPIENVSDLENAIQAYGRAKDKAAAKKHIKERASALGAEDKIPDSWKVEKPKDVPSDEGENCYTGDRKKEEELEKEQDKRAAELLAEATKILETAKKIYEKGMTAEGNEDNDGDPKAKPTEEEKPKPKDKFKVAGKEILTKKFETKKVKKGLNALNDLSDLILDLAWLKWQVQMEQEYEKDENSPLPSDLQANLESLADTLLAMADEEVEELIEIAKDNLPPTEAAQCKEVLVEPCCGPMWCTVEGTSLYIASGELSQQTQANEKAITVNNKPKPKAATPAEKGTKVNDLEKAHSMSVHLGRMAKAVTDFHDKLKAHHEDHMAKTDGLHKAHHDDMCKSLDHIHNLLGIEHSKVAKILGVEEAETYGDDKPKPQNPEEEGTESLIHIPPPHGGGKVTAADRAAQIEKVLEVAKAGNFSEKTITELELALAVAKSQIPPPKPEPAKAMSAEEIAKLVSETVSKAQTDFLNALFKGGDEEEEDKKCPGCGKPESKCSCKTITTSGIGDRSNVKKAPVVTTPITKAQENGAPIQQTIVTETVDIEKAVGGNQEEGLKLMRGVKPQPVPSTLAEALSKIS